MLRSFEKNECPTLKKKHRDCAHEYREKHRHSCADISSAKSNLDAVIPCAVYCRKNTHVVSMSDLGMPDLQSFMMALWAKLYFWGSCKIISCVCGHCSCPCIHQDSYVRKFADTLCIMCPPSSFVILFMCYVMLGVVIIVLWVIIKMI